MNLFLIFAAVFATSLQFASAGDELLESVRRIGAMQKTGVPFDETEYMSISDEALRNWSVSSEDDRNRFSMKMFLVHFRRAQIFSDAGDFKSAATELADEVALQVKYGGRIEFSTKSPVSFFIELIELQAQVTAETGSDPLANKVGYSFQKDGDGFTAARLELGDEIAGITVPEIGADEALALVHRLNRQGGKFVTTASRWLVVPSGRLPDVLEQATREVAFESSGKMIVHRLQTKGNSSPKVNASATTNTTSPQVPELVHPSAPKQVTEAKPSPTRSEDSTLSTPGSIIVVIIVIAIGLPWLLLKKRK